MGRRLPVLSGVLIASGLYGCSFLLTGDYSGEAPASRDGGDVADRVSETSSASDAPIVVTEDAGVDADAGPPTYAEIVIADAPLGYWRLSETSGTTFKDSMGSGHDLVATGNVTLGQKGALAKNDDGAIRLSGIPLSAGPAFDISGVKPFTIEAWVRPTATDNAYRRVFQRLVFDSGPNHGTYFYINAGLKVVSFERWSEGHILYYGQLAQTTLPSDRFTHLVVTMNGARLDIFRDGALLDTATDIEPIPDPPGDFLWGTGFIGDLDELAFYDKALTGVQVKAHFDAAAR